MIDIFALLFPSFIILLALFRLLKIEAEKNKHD
jgi:hypothetical protein